MRDSFPYLEKPKSQRSTTSDIQGVSIRKSRKIHGASSFLGKGRDALLRHGLAMHSHAIFMFRSSPRLSRFLGTSVKPVNLLK